MGWWSECIVPVITEKACNTKEIKPYRARLCSTLGGDVLEIGFGSGHNVQYLPPGVHGLWAVEPSERARRYAERRIGQSSIPVKFAGLDGQSLDLPDNRFDHAVSAFTLCTIPDPGAALREVLRVLKPGGQFHFVEHGRSPDPKVSRFQRRWDPVQRRLFAGCHVSRPIADLVEEAGLRIEELKHAQLQGPKAFGYIYEGVALVPN
jgi:ubiquinone/menaquinone biosynthesis C-methylase UbiE